MFRFIVLFGILATLATPRPTEERYTKNGLYRRDTVIPRGGKSMPITRREVPSPIGERGHVKRQQLTSNARANLHAVSINLGGKDVNLYLDTGSSNIWTIDTNFQCIDINGNPIDNVECKFVDSGFDPATATGSKIEPSFFNTGYSGGEYMIGYGWKSDATFNGVTVKDQLFGGVTKAHWAGDGYTSGLLGMGSLYTNQIYQNDTTSPVPGDDNRVVFPNPFTEAWKQGLSSEYHTLALDRVPLDEQHNGVQPAGSLSFGGVPSDIALSGKQVTIPVIKWTVGAQGAQINEQAWSAPDALTTFTFEGSDKVDQTPVYANMDTGSSGIGLPSPAFKAWSKLITSTACDGSGMPALAWNVDGVDLSFDKRDLLGYNGPDNCYSMVYDAGTNAALGPNFAQNNVFTWNKATGEVTIMERAPY